MYIMSSNETNVMICDFSELVKCGFQSIQHLVFASMSQACGIMGISLPYMSLPLLVFELGLQYKLQISEGLQLGNSIHVSWNDVEN